MPNGASRLDSWIQVGILACTLAGALWSVAGKLSSIEQQLSDDSRVHAEELQRIERLEQRFIDGGYFRK